MTEQWKNVQIINLGALHLAHQTKIVFDDGSTILGRLTNVEHRLNFRGQEASLETFVSVLLNDSPETFKLDDEATVSVLDGEASS